MSVVGSSRILGNILLQDGIGRYRVSSFLKSINNSTTACRKYSKTSAADPKLIEVAGETEDNEMGLIEKEEATMQMRNKSRLLPQHRNMLNNNVPYSEPMSWYHKTVKYRRKLYGKHGELSGVNPGIMWPTREEISQIKHYEKVAYPETITVMIEQCMKKKREEAAAYRARQEDIETKFAKLDQWKEELNERISKKLKQAQAAKEKKDRLVEEVRQHFGFNVDPKDERFKEMLEKKEKEEKKSVKEAKRKAKEAKMIARLTQQHQATETEG